MKIMIALCVVLCLSIAPAHGQYTCDDVRRAYQQYGSAALNQWAKEYGVTRAQRKAAIACIHGRRVVTRKRR